MKIQNGYMLAFGLVAIVFSFSKAQQSATYQQQDDQIINRTPADVTYLNNGTGNTVLYNGVPVAPTGTLPTATSAATSPQPQINTISQTNTYGVAPIIPQVATYNMIERSYTSALYNETQLKLQQDAIAAKLTEAQNTRAQMAQKSPATMMYPNNTYDVAIKNLQAQVTTYKNARANNLTNAMMNMDYTYASVKYSLTRDQMLQASLERNHLIKLHRDIFNDITLPYDTSGVAGENMALLNMVQQYQQSQYQQQPTAPAAPVTQQPDTRTYAMPAEPALSTPTVAAPTANQTITPTAESYTEGDYLPLAPITTAI